MTLTPAELQSAVWIKLREHLESVLAEKRSFNDGHTLTEVETAALRGEIRCLKRLLSLEPTEVVNARTPSR